MNIKNFFVLFASVFLTVSSFGAAVVPIDYNNYVDGSCYAAILALDTDGDKVSRWEGLVKDSPGFNHKKDTDIIRSSQSGLLTRKAFIKLSDVDFVKVVGSSLLFFSRPFGFSLIHGWMLNKFKDSTTPYYIDKYFSFDKFFFGMIGRLRVPDEAKNIIKRAWFSARKNVETNRWEYYDHMLYLPYAIDQVAANRSTNPPLSIDMVMSMSHASEATDIAFLNKTPQEFVRFVETSKTGLVQGEYIANAEMIFPNIIGWLLNHYNLDALLPAGKRITDVNAFVEFIVEHVKELYQDPISDAGGPVNNIELRAIRAQKGKEISSFVNVILDQFKATYQNDEYALQAINDAIALVRKNRTRPAQLVQIPAKLIPIYAEDHSAAGSAAAFVVASPTKLGAGRAPLLSANSGKPLLEEKGVYATPLMETWMDAANSNTPLVGLSAYEVADILKFFESYLTKVKHRGGEFRGKGPLTGSRIGTRTYLSEVLAWRYRVLAKENDPQTVAAALAFINHRKQDFFNSLQTQRLMN